MNVGVLASGSGTNLQALIDRAARGELGPARLVVVGVNVPDCAALARAKAAALPTFVLDHRDYPTRAAFDQAVLGALRAKQVDLVVLAGFMRILSDGFVRGWEGSLINIHPSLLPAYKGTRVHERVIAAGEILSGASVHFVVPELDAGPVIAQATVPVHPADTPQNLADRVLEVEHKLYPEALKLLATDKVRLQNGLAVFR